MMRLILGFIVVVIFFFFSSRRRHTRLQGDWSSDVCSSDLSGSTEWRAITPHYLQVMRIPVLRGRGLTDRDNASGAPVVLINQAVAERFFPGQDPLGQHVVIGAGAEAMGLADRVRNRRHRRKYQGIWCGSARTADTLCPCGSGTGWPYETRQSG